MKDVRFTTKWYLCRMKRTLHQFITYIVFSIVCVAGCDKMQPEAVEEDIIVCPFCNEEFASEAECLEHQKTCDQYTRKEEALFMIPADSNYPGSTNVDAAHWMSKLPRDTRLVDLTIPGLHDAATYCYNSCTTPTWIKDQNIDYRDAWNKGARAFDLRLGYDGRNFQGSFEERCKFFHGDALIGILTGTCMMYNFHIDVTGHFPTEDQLKGETMILITKKEFMPVSYTHLKLNVFEYFMRLIIERYGRDTFIEYSPDLTLADCEGKIILFTREKTYTEDYSYIGGVPSVPVNYIESFPSDGKTGIETYRNGKNLKSYSAYVQDHYDVGSCGKGSDKYNSFKTALANRKSQAPDEIFFDGMNGVQEVPSWEVCVYMNDKVGSDLKKLNWDSEYKQSLGIVLTDFYGVDDFNYGFWWEPRDFKGNELACQLVSHNFKRLVWK